MWDNKLWFVVVQKEPTDGGDEFRLGVRTTESVGCDHRGSRLVAECAVEDALGVLEAVEPVVPGEASGTCEAGVKVCRNLGDFRFDARLTVEQRQECQTASRCASWGIGTMLLEKVR